LHRLIKDGSRPYRVLFRPFAKMVLRPPVPIAPYLTHFTGINSFVEPNFHVYEVHHPILDRALSNFRANLPFNAEEGLVVDRCREGRIMRIQLCEEQIKEAVRWQYILLEGALADQTTDLTSSRNCSGKVHPLALCYLCYSVSADFGQERRAYFRTPYEIFSRKVLR
jgi:hypothetical protein